MSFKLGNTNIGELYVGSNKIAQAYLGSNLVYQASAPAPSFDEVTIGTQTWMAKNLAIDDGGGGIYHEDNVSANGVNFGTQYYYNRDAAVRVANSIDGWHLPSLDELNTLITYCGGDTAATYKLKSTYGWNSANNGTDDYGFCALPVGDAYTSSCSVGSLSYFCSNDTLWQQGTTYYYAKYISNSQNKFYQVYYSPSLKVPVRLIKD